MSPTVSIILPTYNRARFLPQALASIRGQQWSDWELIIVDDGSTDETPELIGELTAPIEQPVKFIRQENQGAYGARNTGLDHATGRYIAFYDSDDEWLPHHLQDCVQALEANPEIDWVYAACRIVDKKNGRVLAESTFYENGRPRDFLCLTTRSDNALRIIPPHVLRHKLLFRHPPYCGFQNSVIHRRCFNHSKLLTNTKNEAEDSLFLIRHIIRGGSLSYINNVHVVYNVHDSHASAAGTSEPSKQAAVLRAVIDGYQDFKSSTKLTLADTIAYRKMLQKTQFWRLGYSTLWASGDHAAALNAMKKGLLTWPFSLRCWKTYVLSKIRLHCNRRN